MLRAVGMGCGCSAGHFTLSGLQGCEVGEGLELRKAEPPAMPASPQSVSFDPNLALAMLVPVFDGGDRVLVHGLQPPPLAGRLCLRPVRPVCLPAQAFSGLDAGAAGSTAVVGGSHGVLGLAPDALVGSTANIHTRFARSLTLMMPVTRNMSLPGAERAKRSKSPKASSN
mmetsp:Transcript_17904/g.42106  ORF Transcript_17904/g.42106 Transcript_17904/m.42106 type:complete len:170 (+) Transcript_17904:617-1126(+)